MNEGSVSVSSWRLWTLAAIRRTRIKLYLWSVTFLQHATCINAFLRLQAEKGFQLIMAEGLFQELNAYSGMAYLLACAFGNKAKAELWATRAWEWGNIICGPDASMDRLTLLSEAGIPLLTSAAEACAK